VKPLRRATGESRSWPHPVRPARPNLGGGGGNQQKEPPKKAELPGKEKITVPVVKPPEPKPAEQEKPQEDEKLNIPAVTLTAANETSPGVIDSKAPDTTSQGTGTNGGAGDFSPAQLRQQLEGYEVS